MSGATESDLARSAPASSPRLGAVSPGVGFWLVTFIFSATMLGTTLPTPLYVIYQARWKFSAGLITVIFAVYAVGVLAALLLAGRSSDEAGRRPVLAVALACSAISAVFFLVASSPGWLFPGRIISGLSAGLMTGTATATLTDLAGGASTRRASAAASLANLGGLGLGPLLAGVLAQYAPHPTSLVFVVDLALVALAYLALEVTPETVHRRRRPSLRFQGLGLPTEGRVPFLAACANGFVAFTLFGLFSALAPTLLGTTLHEHSHAVGGAVVFLIFAVAAVVQLFVAPLRPSRAIPFAVICFLASLALIVASLSEASFALFLTGTVLGGAAVGAMFIASLSTANRLAPPEGRGRMVSTYFVFSYLGLSIPVIAFGEAAQHVGDFRPALVCAVALAVLAVATGLIAWRAAPAAAPRNT